MYICYKTEKGTDRRNDTGSTFEKNCRSIRDMNNFLQKSNKKFVYLI